MKLNFRWSNWALKHTAGGRWNGEPASTGTLGSRRYQKVRMTWVQVTEILNVCVNLHCLGARLKQMQGYAYLFSVLAAEKQAYHCLLLAS